MINDAIIKTKIYAVIRKYLKSEATILWELQGQPRPAKPFCSMNFLTGPIKQGEDEEVVNDDNKVEKQGLRELTLSVNYFGEHAMQELGYLITALGFPTARELLLKDADLVFIAAAGPRDLSSLMENKFETRAQVDLRFRVIGSMADPDSDVIETVVLENGIDNSSTEINSL